MLDVIIMVNVIISNSDFDLDTADMNNDGLINVSYLVILINIILG